MRHAVAPLLLASALSAHEKSVWRTTTDLGLVQQYRNCTFMMSRYMADGDNQCNDSRFYVWREPKPPRTARALKRSSARASTAETMLGFAPALAGRELVFMGDSLSRQHYISFACRFGSLLTQSSAKWGRKDETTRYLRAATALFDTARMPGARALRSKKTKHEHAPASAAAAPASTFVLRLEPDRPVHKLGAWFREQCARLGARDVIITNLGAHYAFDPAGFVGNLSAAAAELKALRRAGACAPTILWREIAANHFKSGMWHGKSGKKKARCYDRSPKQDERIDAAGAYSSLNARANELMRGAGASVLDIYGASLAAGGSAHIAGKAQDCVHWCLPGVPDQWTLMSLLRVVGDSGEHQVPSRHGKLPPREAPAGPGLQGGLS